MELYPAIDLRGGCAVRLIRGDFARETVYSGDPLAVARDFRAAGAKRLHVVDLDGARDGIGANGEIIRRLIRETGLFVEVGGGIRCRDRIREWLSVGAGRVILGTVALENPEFTASAVREFGSAIAVGVDASEGKVAVRGWREVSDRDAFDFCRSLSEAGVQTIIYTNIGRDGTGSGSDHDAYRRLVGLGGFDVIASGGIASVEELQTLAGIGVSGAILGKSLYTGAICLSEAVNAIEGGQSASGLGNSGAADAAGGNHAG